MEHTTTVSCKWGWEACVNQIKLRERSEPSKKQVQNTSESSFKKEGRIT